MKSFVQRIIRPKVNVRYVRLPFHSRGARREREASPVISSIRSSRRRTPRILLLVVGLLVAASGSAVLTDDTADTLLQRALYFSDLYNWRAARPYFTRSQEMFEAVGDKRNALYARLGAIRAGAEPAPLPRLSYMLDEELAANPLLQSDKELRMFCLIVKGDFDGESDTPAMRRDWTEVASLAQALGNTKWQYRAQGQLGFADFYDGDLPGAQRNVAQALIGAMKTGDIGGQIFYLSTTATGLVLQGMNDQATQYANRAIAIADANPDSGYPIIAHQARLSAMVQAGQVAAAQEEIKKLLSRPEAQASDDQLSELNSMAAQIARSQGDMSSAIAYLTEAVRHSEIVANTHAIPEFQSELSDIYRLMGNLSQAEVLARRAAASAQADGYIPLIPKMLKTLAEIQVSRKEYSEADQTYDRAATIQDVMIGNADSALGKTALIKGVGDLYAKHFALIAEHGGDPAKAFTVVEQARGRVMTDLLMSGNKTSPESLATEKNIARLRLELTGAHSDKDIEKLRDQIFMAEQSRSVTPEVSILKAREHQVITVRQLQDSLSNSEALLEYVMDEPASYCLVITRASARIVKLPGEQALSSLTIAYLDKLKAKERGRRRGPAFVRCPARSDSPDYKAQSSSSSFVMANFTWSRSTPWLSRLDGMLSSPEQSFMLRPQRVSFCCVRQQTVNHQHEDCSRSEVFLTSKAGQGSGIFRVQGTRRWTPQRHCQTRQIPCSSAKRLRKRRSRSRSIIESFTSPCTPLQITPAPIEPLLFSSAIHSTERTGLCTPRKSFSSRWTPI